MKYIKVRKADASILKMKTYENPNRDFGKETVWLPLVENNDAPDGVDLDQHTVVREFRMPDLSGDLTNAVVVHGLKKIDMSNAEKLSNLNAALTEKLLNGQAITADEIAQRKALKD